jgi:hypothetical protein
LPQALAGLAIILNGGRLWPLLGCGTSLISTAILAKTTWNYLNEKSNEPAMDQPLSKSDAKAP